MKNKFALILSITASALFFSACNHCDQGSGKMITENRTIRPFSQIEISGGYKLIIKQDTGSVLKITADDNLMKNIETDVNGDKLVIKTKNNSCNSGTFTVNVSTKELSALVTAGAVEVQSDGKLNLKDLDMQLSGASKVNLDLNAANVSTHTSGTIEMNLKGQATSHKVEMSGTGELNALDFIVGKYDITSSGLTHCHINVLTDLSVNSSGASDVEYRGNPSNVNNNKSGASTLKKIN
jgi:hypothetical protein